MPHTSTSLRFSRLGVNLAFILLVFAGLSIRIHAQTPESIGTTVTGETATPIPGAGHDYIHLLSETVDPSSGSVSLNIQVPVPKSRGITLPFSFTYSSAGVYHLDGTGYWASDSIYPARGTLHEGGWEYSVPSASYSNWTWNVPSACGDPNCNSGSAPGGSCEYWSNYTFTDPSGATHNLGLGEAYVASITNGGVGGPSCPFGANPQNVVSSSAGGDSRAFAQYTSPNSYLSGSSVYGYSPINFNVYDVAGTVYSFEGAWGTCGGGLTLPVTIEDRNGNIIKPSLTASKGHGEPAGVD